METINTNIELINIPQKYGPYGKQWVKNDYIKHKRKTIDGISYNTKKSRLVYFKQDWHHSSYFHLEFLYETENEKYFQRIFTQMGESAIKLVDKQYVIDKVNSNKSLF